MLYQRNHRRQKQNLQRRNKRSEVCEDEWRFVAPQIKHSQLFVLPQRPRQSKHARAFYVVLRQVIEKSSNQINQYDSEVIKNRLTGRKITMHLTLVELEND